MSAFSSFVCFGWCTSGGLPLFDLVASSINAFKIAKLWLIRARRLFSINGLFVRLTVVVVFVVVAVSWAATGDGDAVDDDGEMGPEFTVEFALLTVADDVFGGVESAHKIKNENWNSNYVTLSSARFLFSNEW